MNGGVSFNSDMPYANLSPNTSGQSQETTSPSRLQRLWHPVVDRHVSSCCYNQSSRRGIMDRPRAFNQYQVDGNPISC